MRQHSGLWLIFIVVLTTVVHAAGGHHAGNAGQKPASADVVAIPAGTPYSFTRAPFINPLIIRDLSTSLADLGDQVVEINLAQSQESNRYFGRVRIGKNKNGFPNVYVADDTADIFNPPAFGYKFIGKTQSGIYVLQTSDCGGGSGIFENLLLLVFEHDYGVTFDNKKHTLLRGDARLLLKKIGEIPLGDRWTGKVTD